MPLFDFLRVKFSRAARTFRERKSHKAQREIRPIPEEENDILVD